MNADKVKLGIAPIAWSNDDMPELGGENTFEQCISEMALAGFTGTEVGNKYPKDPEILKPYLDIRGLRVANQWFSSYFTSLPQEETVKLFREQLKFLKAMGATVIGCSEQGNSIQGKDIPVLGDEKPRFTDEEWKKVAEGHNELGRIAKEEGITLTYHHHMGTGVQTMEETERFLEMTDPDLVFLLFDSGHFAFSSEDPVAALNKFYDRVRHVHLKDVRHEVVSRVRWENMSFLDAVRSGAFTVPGDGDIDFPSIFEILEIRGYEGWMIVEAEQDPALANPFKYAKMARQYIREQTGL